MLLLEVPGWKRLRLEHLVLDINGTLTMEGELLPGVAERIEALKRDWRILLLTADTYGKGAALARTLGVPWHRLTPGPVPEAVQKRQVVEALGPEGVVAIGNGRNDVQMLQAAALGIAVLGEEGLAAEALQAADVVVTSPTAALDLLLHPLRLVATLRG